MAIPSENGAPLQGSLLLAHEGVANTGIADQLKVSRPTVLALRAAFAKDGLTAITGVRRRKREAKVLKPELETRILDTTLNARPGDGSTQWSVQTLAALLHTQECRGPTVAQA